MDRLGVAQRCGDEDGKGNQRGTWREEIRIVEGAWEVGCWVFGGKILLCAVVNVLFSLYVEGQLRLGKLSSSMFGVGKYDVFVYQ